MKRIILSSLMCCMLVQQAHGLFSELASGFALSTAIQAAYAGLNYWAPNSVPKPNQAIDATYQLSLSLLFAGSLGGYCMGRMRIVSPYRITYDYQQLEQLCYGVALGSLAGFASCYVAKYMNSI